MLKSLSREDQTVNTVDVLSDGIEKLREEHIVLKQRLMDLYGLASELGLDSRINNWNDEIQVLRTKIIIFMKEMDVHSEWEDQVLFPMVEEYTGKDMGPVAVMEHEHGLAKQNVKRFLEATDKLTAPVTAKQAKEAASYLLQAYVILSDHFRKEEEVLFPIAEQMLTDIEQFFIT